jgi:MFS family permease
MGLIAFSFSRSFLLSLVLMVAIGLGMMLQMACSNTILQTIVEDDKRGRVMSFFTMAFMGTAPFGSFMAGSLASSIGVSNTLLFGGISCIVGAYFYSRKLPELKKSIRPIYIKLGIITETQEGIPVMSELTVPTEE